MYENLAALSVWPHEATPLPLVTFYTGIFSLKFPHSNKCLQIAVQYQKLSINIYVAFVIG
jgi:hypothetical protein